MSLTDIVFSVLCGASEDWSHFQIIVLDIFKSNSIKAYAMLGLMQVVEICHAYPLKATMSPKQMCMHSFYILMNFLFKHVLRTVGLWRFHNFTSIPVSGTWNQLSDKQIHNRPCSLVISAQLQTYTGMHDACQTIMILCVAGLLSTKIHKYKTYLSQL